MAERDIIGKTDNTHYRLKLAFVGIVVLNLLLTLYLVKTVRAQQRRIQTLESHDQVKQSVDKLNTKFDSLKSRVEGLLR